MKLTDTCAVTRIVPGAMVEFSSAEKPPPEASCKVFDMDASPSRSSLMISFT